MMCLGCKALLALSASIVIADDETTWTGTCVFAKVSVNMFFLPLTMKLAFFNETSFDNSLPNRAFGY